jgi:hypothetical protein
VRVLSFSISFSRPPFLAFSLFSNMRANRLASNFDTIERELDDLRAQRNAAIQQTNLAKVVGFEFRV